MKHPRLLIPVVLLLLVCAVQAQLQVDLKMSRSLYMVHEPTLAQVTITNLSGRDLNLEDEPGHPWFSFEIFAGKDSLVPPIDPNYQLEPLYIPAGKSVKRTINLTPLYSLQDFGPHSIKAVIYVKDQDRYFGSNRKAIEITEGRLIWSQTVGASPADGGGDRTWSLLTHRLPKNNQLYVRIVDQPNSRVVSCFGLGPTLSFAPPEHQLDSLNQLHVLQMTGPNTYLYSHVDLNGRVLARETHYKGKISYPRLFREESGLVRVRGGKKDVPVPEDQQVNAPRLSDRPVALPQ